MASEHDNTGGAAVRPDEIDACDAHGFDDHFHWPTGYGIRTSNIALQGGGVHGAFAWGGLDRLLEEKRLSIESISGTSAGAVNAGAMVEGLHHRGPDESHRRLEANPMLAIFEMMSRVVSRYQFNPFNRNALKEMLEERVDFSDVQACLCTPLYISATNVRTGRVPVFRARRSRRTP